MTTRDDALHQETEQAIDLNEKTCPNKEIGSALSKTITEK